MTITITGATGHLGRLVIEELLGRGVPAGRIVAVVRSAQKAAGLAALGVQVREADYGDPQTLTAALAGTEKLLLISGTDFGRRVEQHRNVIEAAQAAGVSLLAYTSAPHADTTTLALAPEHKGTEEVLLASGLPYVLLRNNWYHENYTADLAAALEHGVILGAAGDGRVSGAARADYAAAAAVVLTTDGHENKVYELAGDESFSKADLAAEVSRQSGKPVAYRDLTVAEYAAALTGFGLPEPVANVIAEVDAGVGAGLLHDEDRVLSRLIGRPTTPLADSVAVALKA